MTFKQKAIHERAVAILSRHGSLQFEILQVLQEAESVKLFRSFGCRSLFQYAVSELKLSEPMALAFISVMRKAREVSELNEALQKNEICVSKANRLASVLTKENAKELIGFATTHTWRETETEIAKRNPKVASPDRVKVLSEQIAQLMISLPVEALKDFERVASLEAQRSGKSPSRGEVLQACFNAYLEKYDPVRRAERIFKKRSAHARQVQAKARKSTVYKKRIPATAAQTHAVKRRDQGRCTHVDQHGRRCNEDRWVHSHHIIPVAQGGSNDPSNLTTLCSFHHDLVHQLSLPIDGQINWLRSPRRAYMIWARPESAN